MIHTFVAYRVFYNKGGLNEKRSIHGWPYIYQREKKLNMNHYYNLVSKIKIHEYLVFSSSICCK
ncbi:hypothetical protein Hanom_Chr05g00462791 [Helianthus anomalus]